MHETFIWKPTEGWDISSCDISYSLRFTPRRNSCEGSSFPFPLNVFSPFLSFFGSLIIFSRMPSELSDCRYLCDRDLLGNPQKKNKCCKNKATEGWGIQRDGSKKCGQMNVLPDTALASLREPRSHTTAVMNIPPCLAIPFPLFPCFSLLSLYPSSGCKLPLSTRNSLLSKLLFC